MEDEFKTGQRLNIIIDCHLIYSLYLCEIYIYILVGFVFFF